MESVVIGAGVICLFVLMVMAVRRAKGFRFENARKHKAGLILMSSLLFGVGQSFDQPPPRAEEVRNKNLEKKSETAGSKNETE